MLADIPAEPPDGTYRRWRTYHCALTRGEPAAQGPDGVATLEAVAWLALDDEAAWPADVRDDRFLAPQLRHLRNSCPNDTAPAVPTARPHSGLSPANSPRADVTGSSCFGAAASTTRPPAR